MGIGKMTVFGIVALSMLAGCATTPTPEEICSTGWISSRTDKAQAEFRRDVRPMLRTFRKAESQLQNGNSLGFLQMANVMRAVEKFIARVEDSRALEDLRLVGETCNDPALVNKVMTEFLQDEGAPQVVLDFMNNLDSYRNLLVAPPKSEL